MTIGNKVFPNTEAYVIAFEAGACGNFIKTLLCQYLYGPLSYNISQFGKSHNRYRIYENLTEISRLVNINNSTNPYDHSEPAIPPPVEVNPYNYDLHDPRDVNKPFITVEHLVPNFELLFNKFPKAKTLIITVCDEMAPRVGGNIFYKTIMDEFETNKWYKYRWEQYKEEHPELKKYSHPNQVAIEEIEFATKQHKPLIPKVEVPNEYSQNVFIMSLKDLFYNKEKVLNLISEITGKSYNVFHMKYYNEYLKKQEELVKTKMSWVTM